MFPIFIFLAVLAAAVCLIHWLNRSLARYSAGQSEFSEQFEKQERERLEKGSALPFLLPFALLLLPVAAQADSIDSFPLRIPVRITDKLEISDTALYLRSNTVLPLLGNTAELLATNLWAAQLTANLHQADSLFLSETMVLRAITFEVHQYSENGVWYGDSYCDQSNCELAWLQSKVATDDRARATLTPPVLDFGDVPVVPQRSLATPEPGTFSLMASAILALVITAYWKRRP